MELPCYSGVWTILYIILWAFVYGMFIEGVVTSILGNNINLLLRSSIPILLILTWFDNTAGLGFVTCKGKEILT